MNMLCSKFSKLYHLYYYMQESINYIKNNAGSSSHDLYLRNVKKYNDIGSFPKAGKLIRTQKYLNGQHIKIEPNQGITNIRLEKSENVGKIEIIYCQSVENGDTIFQAHCDFCDFSKPIPIITSAWDKLNNIDSHKNVLPYIGKDAFWKIYMHAKDDINMWERVNLQYNFVCIVDVVEIEYDYSIGHEYVIKENQYFNIPYTKNYYMALCHPTFSLKLRFYGTNPNIKSVTLKCGMKIDECEENFVKLPFTQNGSYWVLDFPINKNKNILVSDELINFSTIFTYLSVDGTDYSGCILEQSHHNVLRHMSGLMGLAYLNADGRYNVVNL